jgi:hypothetical protein
MDCVMSSNVLVGIVAWFYTVLILLGIVGAFYAIFRAITNRQNIAEKDRISNAFLAVLLLHSAFIVGIVIYFLAFNFEDFASNGLSALILDSISVLLLCCHSIVIISVTIFLNLKGAVRPLAVVFSLAYSVLVTYGFVGFVLLSPS